MTAEQQRIAIAEACGTMKWGYGLPTKCIAFNVPDYPNDLNACHEFEKSLPSSLTQEYWWSLCDVTGLDQYEACRDPLLTVSATAPQRCEAFLKTIGKWEGEA